MSKKLAIRGHSTRGKEVIELLEMMGGSNIRKLDGTAIMYSYYLSNNIILSDRLSISEDDDFEIFSLKEFLEKYPFKVGDRVIDVADGYPGVISEMKWDQHVSDMKYCVVFENGIEFVDFGWFANDSIEFCKDNKTLEEKQVNPMKNVLAELLEHIKNTSKEELKREVEEFMEWSNVGPTVEEFMDFCNKINKKPKYPTTYKECCDVLEIPNDERYIDIDVPLDYNKVLSVFTELIICRKAYWKIAGEELGLDKPWEPQFENCSIPHYCLFINHTGEVCKDCFYGSRCLLAFPTAEMRDAFYENFKDLIEQCKYFL